MRNEEDLPKKRERAMNYRRKAKKKYEQKRKKSGIPGRVSGKKLSTKPPSYREVRTPAISSEEAFRREEESFVRLKRKLLADVRYRGKFVAFVNQKIVAVGTDDRELSRIIDEEFGNVTAFIGKVEAKEEVIEVPSPELK